MMFDIPSRSLFKLCPTRIVPLDSNFFILFYKNKVNNFKQLCITSEAQKNKPDLTCISANEQVTPTKSSAVSPVISDL